MNKWNAMALTLSLGMATMPMPDDFVHPKAPFAPGIAKAPSPEVTNGTVFESGALSLAEDQVLSLPYNAVVEEYDGTSVRFFLTKSLECYGHPPRSMRFEESRSHFGIAQRVEDEVVVISTFGEWSNRGGSASIRLLVMVPRDLDYTLDEGLHGDGSEASSEFRISDEALSDCYWYAGPRPKNGWTAIETSLHYSRFLAPR